MRLPEVYVRDTRPEDFPNVVALCNRVYPNMPAWTEKQLASHHAVFPEGQLIAVERGTELVLGMAASLIVKWDDYDSLDSYRDFTDAGFFTNHDPEGRTLYGAEVMVDPQARRRRIGSKLYKARRELTERLGLLRIRAGARLPAYHRYADKMTAEAYVQAVVNGELRDPTLSFQLRQGFHVLALVPDYFKHDVQSRGFAVLIEWLNLKVASLADYTHPPI